MGKVLSITVSNDLLRDRRMHRISDALIEGGFQVFLLGVQKIDAQCIRLKNYNQKRVKPIFQNSFLFYLEINIRFFVKLVKLRPDILYAVDFDTLIANTLYHKIFKNKMIFDAHEYFTEVPEVHKNKFKKYLWNRIGKWGIANSDLCLTVGQKLAEIFSKSYNAKFHTIRNIPPISEQKNHVRQNIFVYLGDLNPGRGLENCIKAIEKVDAQLQIIGDGPLRKKLEEMVKMNQLEQKVFFTGYLQPTDISLHLLRAYAGLNILDNSSKSYYYSLANKFFDYIHHQIPIIGSQFPEYKEINKQFQILIPTKNTSSEIAKSMNFLLNNQANVEKMRESCFIAAKELNWSNEKVKLTTLIKEI